VCFGLLNNQPPFLSTDFHSFHPSEADYPVSEQFIFYVVRLLASRPTPNLEDQGIPLVGLLLLDLSGMGVPTSNYTTTGIALRVSEALKPHHHDKVKTPSVGNDLIKNWIFPNQCHAYKVVKLLYKCTSTSVSYNGQNIQKNCEPVSENSKSLFSSVTRG
jgi:uncharacterized Fe-S cluster protein YjdI